MDLPCAVLVSHAALGGRSVIVFSEDPLQRVQGLETTALRLALAADAWSRTYRSQAIAVADSDQPVRLASGLLLLPTSIATQPKSARNVVLSRDAKPVCQLDKTLNDIAQAFGRATRDWVATQLEYGAQAAQSNACEV